MTDMSNEASRRYGWSNTLLIIIASVSVVLVYRSRQAELESRRALGDALTVQNSFQKRLAEAQLDLSLVSAFARNARPDSSLVIEGRHLDGSLSSISLQHLVRPTLLYSIDVRCATCLANIPFLNRLTHERPCGLDVYGVILTPLRDGLFSAERPSFPLLGEVRGEALNALPIGIPSSAVLIGEGGSYLKSWRGVFDDVTQSDLRAVVESSCQS